MGKRGGGKEEKKEIETLNSVQHSGIVVPELLPEDSFFLYQESRQQHVAVIPVHTSTLVNGHLSQPCPRRSDMAVKAFCVGEYLLHGCPLLKEKMGDKWAGEFHTGCLPEEMARGAAEGDGSSASREYFISALSQCWIESWTWPG